MQVAALKGKRVKESPLFPFPVPNIYSLDARTTDTMIVIYMYSSILCYMPTFIRKWDCGILRDS